MNTKKYALQTMYDTDTEEDFSLFLSTLTANGLQPFAGEDSSVGMEYELQVAVEGSHQDVDLTSTIRNSSYFKNIAKRIARGDLPSGCLESLKKFLCRTNDSLCCPLAQTQPRHQQ